jgi:hypothetical protein
MICEAGAARRQTGAVAAPTSRTASLVSDLPRTITESLRASEFQAPTNAGLSVWCAQLPRRGGDAASGFRHRDRASYEAVGVRCFSTPCAAEHCGADAEQSSPTRTVVDVHDIHASERRSVAKHRAHLRQIGGIVCVGPRDVVVHLGHLEPLARDIAGAADNSLPSPGKSPRGHEKSPASCNKCG